MSKILNSKAAIQLSNNLQKQGKRLVLAGGCFDILHIGHMKFLTNAKAKGDVLFVMLEHDAVIKRNKGEHRPLNPQADRATILAALEIVDAVISLPETASDTFYDDLVISLKPAIIATTAGDPYRKHKERQAKEIGAKVIDVIDTIKNQSTTKLIKILNEL